jgi:lysophospholipase L1-like esterase
MVAVNDSSDVEKDIVCYDNATIKYKIRSSYDQLRIMYGNSSEVCYLNSYNGSTGEILSKDSLPPTQGMKIHKVKMSSPVLNVKLQFTSNNSPEFYGLFFDSYKGVQVDNYAIRGHSGDGLMLINPEFLAQQLKTLNVKLIIFQYGANVVPYIKNEESCKWLKTVYSDLFARFKQAAPNTSILVIGAGDMARHVEGGYASYKMLPRIRDIQREAALENGCTFFDLFGMMGGLNSIMTWSQKRLASNDGHLSPKGQEILGNELFSGLMVEYNMYLYKNKKKN